MLATRRNILLGIGSVAAAIACKDDNSFADDLQFESPPNELGFADFAGVWQTEPGIQVVADVPDLPPGTAERFAGIRFASANDADSLFLQYGRNRKFINWFNDECAGKDYWSKRKITGSQSDYESFWDQFLGSKNLTLMQFLAYMAVFTNEVEGSLKNKSEGFGRKGHSGIAYLFDKVTLVDPASNRTWTKASYNTGKNNISAYSLFNDLEFNATQGNKPLAKELQKTTNKAWAGDNYSLLGYSTAADEKIIGYILAADFYKFRGRGLIQTTWRTNYNAIVQFVKDNPKASELVLRYSQAWAGRTNDKILTSSSDSDWDDLFNDPKKVVLCEAIKLHEEPSNYASLSNGAKINGKTQGSLAFMGESIGGRGYGQRLKVRVRQMCLALGDI
jgi:hypothetical protein